MQSSKIGPRSWSRSRRGTRRSWPWGALLAIVVTAGCGESDPAAVMTGASDASTPLAEADATPLDSTSDGDAAVVDAADGKPADAGSEGTPGPDPRPPLGCTLSTADVPFGGRCRDLRLGGLRDQPVNARVYAPAEGTAGAPYPVVVQLPGGAADFDSTEWSAVRLAEAGYVVINVRPASGGSEESYSEAGSIGLDFLASPDNPFRAESDLERVGATGWSLGAHSLVLLQDEDRRVDAIVAYDTLASQPEGDAGSLRVCQSGMIPSGTPRTARVPGLGFTIEQCPNMQPFESKLTGFRHFRAAGQPTMLLTLSGELDPSTSGESNHFWFGTRASVLEHDVIAYYAIAWLDRFVRGDASASARLLARDEILGLPLARVLTTKWPSAVSVEGVFCENWRTGC